MTLGEASHLRSNNFDTLRLLAASIVLLSHCFPLVGRAEPFAPVVGETLGGLGVSIFFAISGFLVTKSWLTDAHPRAYAIKRGLRLLPALFVVALLSAFALGPLVTTSSLGNYLGSLQPYLYVVKNTVLVTINGRLPGVFDSNAVAGAVNGSLWTLPVEAGCYLMVAVAGVLALLRRPVVLIAGLLVLLVVTSPYAGIDVNFVSTPGDAAGAGVSLALALAMIAIFIVSMLLFIWRERVPLSPPLFLVAIVAIALAAQLESRLYVSVTTVAIPYATLFAAYWRPGPAWLTRPGDVSYGIYLYAFPVQQAVVHLHGTPLAPWLLFAIAYPVTYVLALASWKLVEAPALRCKTRFAVSARAAPAAV